MNLADFQLGMQKHNGNKFTTNDARLIGIILICPKTGKFESVNREHVYIEDREIYLLCVCEEVHTI